jgi:Txe/YoeB family toxin of Txe-Axe toxin-antitoxin module
LVSWQVVFTTAALRVVYQILDDPKVVKVLRMWTHYE